MCKVPGLGSQWGWTEPARHKGHSSLPWTDQKINTKDGNAFVMWDMSSDCEEPSSWSEKNHLMWRVCNLCGHHEILTGSCWEKSVFQLLDKPDFSKTDESGCKNYEIASKSRVWGSFSMSAVEGFYLISSFCVTHSLIFPSPDLVFFFFSQNGENHP